MEVTDDVIVVEVLGGQRESYRVLVDRYRRQIFNLMYRYSQNDEDAADLTQESFVKAYRRLGQYRPGGRFFSWLYALAVNVAKDWYRNSRRRQSLRLDLARNSEPLGEISQQEIQVQRRQQMDLVEGALAQLSPTTREMVVLRYRHEQGIKEIARIFEMGHSAVKMRISRALRQLRKILEEEGNDEGA